MGRRPMKTWFDYQTWLPPTKEVIAKMHEGRDEKVRAKQHVKQFLACCNTPIEKLELICTKSIKDEFDRELALQYINELKAEPVQRTNARSEE